jgi:hypothetical protein
VVVIGLVTLYVHCKRTLYNSRICHVFGWVHIHALWIGFKHYKFSVLANIQNLIRRKSEPIFSEFMHNILEPVRTPSLWKEMIPRPL